MEIARTLRDKSAMVLHPAHHLHFAILRWNFPLKVWSFDGMALLSLRIFNVLSVSSCASRSLQVARNFQLHSGNLVLGFFQLTIKLARTLRLSSWC